MKAMLNDTVLAEAPESDLIRIEGNWYFPPASVSASVLVSSPTAYTCSWKGECSYYTVTTDGNELADRAWAYLTPTPSAIERVGSDFSGYVAFWKEVRVSD
ncbi:DUF427 domain-containing protein [Microbacterium lacus]|uniref:DUF427 domain-containing protein n=1 Tax=Microbacterium lacus TaxID=415217 RepID=UPI00384BBEE3